MLIKRHRPEVGGDVNGLLAKLKKSLIAYLCQY
jgi:hypothetical protein